MKNQVFFDHIEIYVSDIKKYCEFLVKIFQGGRYKVISESGTSMFKSNDGINIEIKEKPDDTQPTSAGFCNPCLRMENAKAFIENNLALAIDKELQNPDGPVYFFKDHENIQWHIKEYLIQDKYINW